MESLYYSVPMAPARKKVYRLLKKNGVFYCGTDFYKDNRLTTRWTKDMAIPMDLRSEKEWKKMFKNIGFETRTKHILDLKNKYPDIKIDARVVNYAEELAEGVSREMVT